MPLSSAEIAGMSGQFQGMYAQQLQYSGMIGGAMTMSGPPQVQGEQVAGGVMSRMGAVAGPVGGLALGMMGMDPMSMGLKAGMGAYGAGAGVMGGLAAGVGVLGAGAAVGAAAHYVGGQIITGAQQQQQFNSMMRQSFFQNQPYGQGFSTAQLGSMGADIRGMSGMQGAGGEMTTFRELSSLAANMGRMGMATGVRDATQFRQKFQEMLATVKTVATEMGTTLEQAQQAMASMRGSGIFRTADQVKFAMQMRSYSVGGGLSTAELGAMGNIGSQISRSVGGRGSQGAFGGMRTLGMVGGALQTGAIGEEDIYNATGMYGAEGRQAFATRQMEKSASFLQSGRGRYFLASIAGQDGNLSSEGVNAWMGGGMGVGETRAMAHKNLGGIGRANFIRNEGRLRGAAMERFGGLLPAMALSQWAGEKGIDINSMGDREMLFASRQLGMGMDELETTLKEAKNLPKIMSNMQQEGQIDQQLKQIANKRRTQGLEGAKRKLEQARETVQNSLQQLGADIYSSGSDMVERMLNKMAGTYVDTFNADAIRASGTSTSLADFQAKTGIGRAGRSWGGGGLGGGVGSASNSFFGQGQQTGFGHSLMSMLTTSDYETAQKAGYGGMFDAAKGMQPGAGRDKAVADAIASARRSYANMANPQAVPAFAFSQGMKEHLRDMYTGSLGSTQGMDRVNALEKDLAAESAKGNTEATAALKQLQSASPENKMAVALGIEKGGGITAAGRLSAQGPLGVNLGGGRWLSEGERTETIGRMRSGKDWKSELTAGGATGAALLAAGPLGIIAGVLAAPWAINKMLKDRREQLLAGSDATSAEGKEFAKTLAFGNAKEVDAAFKNMQDKVTAMKSQPVSETRDMHLKNAQKDLLSAQLIRLSGGNKPTEEQIQHVLNSAAGKEVGMTKDDLMLRSQGIMSQGQSDQEDALRSYGKVIGAQGELKLGRLNATGLFAADGVLASAVHTGGKTMRIQGQERATLQAYQKMVAAQAATQANPTRETVIAAESAKDEYQKIMGGAPGDYKGLLAGAKESEALGAYDLAREQRTMGAAERDVSRTLGRRGVGGALGSILGVNFNRENAGLMRSISSGKGGENAIAELLGRAGIDTGDEKNKGLLSELTRISGLKGGAQVEAIANLKLGKGEAGERVTQIEKERNAQKQKDENPLLDEINQSLKTLVTSAADGNKSLGLISSFTGAIVTNTMDKDGVGGTKTPAAPAGNP